MEVSEIMLVYRGEAEFVVDGVPFRMKRGDVIMLTEQQRHEIKPVSQSLGCYYCHFQPTAPIKPISPDDLRKAVDRKLVGIARKVPVSPYIATVGRSRTVYVPDRISLGNQQNDVFSLFERAHLERNGSVWGIDLLMHVRLMELLLLLTRESLSHITLPSDRQLGSSARRLVQEAIIRLNDQPRSGQTIAKLCRSLHVTSQYLNRLFDQAMGMSLKTYAQRRQIAGCKEMMRDGRLNLKEIAYRCGFSSSNHMASVFLRVEGCSPRDYINRMNADILIGSRRKVDES